MGTFLNETILYIKTRYNMGKKTIGGLVVKCDELKKIVDKEGIEGLAFGLEEPGKAKGVDLIIFAVRKGKKGLVGHERKVKFKMGAPSTSAPCHSMDEFEFEHADHLALCKFGFAYLSKKDFMELAATGAEELLIGGTVKDYGTTNENITGKWFTLTATTRSNPVIEESALESTIKMGNPPATMWLRECPPWWVPFADTESAPQILESTEAIKTIHFDQA